MKKAMYILILILLAAVIFTFYKNRKPLPKLPTAENLQETKQQESRPGLPDSVLYYGQIAEIKQDKKGKPSKLLMESERSGAYIMNLGEGTVYIDSGERKAFHPESLKADDRVYVFHSPIAAKSLPPQSPALAVVKNIPMDASCPMYHEAENLVEADGELWITTDNGEKTISGDEETKVFSYAGEEKQLSDIKQGDFLMAWYWDRGQTPIHASHLMILPPIS